MINGYNISKIQNMYKSFNEAKIDAHKNVMINEKTTTKNRNAVEVLKNFS